MTYVGWRAGAVPRAVLESVFVRAPVGVAVVDLEGRYSWVNPAFAALAGVDASALIGTWYLQPVLRADWDANLAAGRHALSGAADSYELEERVIRPDGEQRWVRSQICLEREDDGTPVHFVAVVTDLTTEHSTLEAERAAVRSARAAEDRARRLGDLSPDGVVVADLDGRILYANEAFAALLGVSSLELLGQIGRGARPGARGPEAARWVAVRRGETVRGSVERVRVRPGGTIDVEVSSAPINFDGQPAVLSVARDVTERVRQEAALAELQERHRQSFEHAPIAKALVAIDGTWLAVNPALCRLLDLDADRLQQLTFQEITHPDDLDTDLTLMAQTLLGEIPGFSVEKRYLRPDGSVVYANLHVAVVCDEDAEPLYYVAQIEDLTERRGREVQVRQLADELQATNDALQAAVDEAAAGHARFEALVEHSSDLTAITDADGTLRYLSPAWERITGVPVPAAIGRDLWTFVHPEDLGRAADQRRELLDGPAATTSLTCRIGHGDRWRHVEMVVTNRLADPAVSGIVTNARDVTDRVLAANRLAHQAMHDPLTDLPNRALLVDRLEHLLAQHRRHPSPCAVLFIDLDRFKTINDSLGHRAGDGLLVTLAERLRAVVRPADTVARLGGDEFIVLAEDIATPELAFEIADRIRAAVTTPVAIEDHTVTVGCSIGIALSGHHHPDQLLQEADLALYRAKERGRNRAELYDQGLQVLARRRHETEQIIRSALEDGRIEVHHQPIVDLRTGTVTGTEALARIRLPDGKLLLPDDFIPIAEDSGLIVPLGIAVLDLACAQHVAWAAAGDAARQLAVNVSASQLLSSTFVDDISAVLDRRGMPADAVCFEITESTLIDAGPSARRQIDRLKGLGVTLALDDFGTGWCSLSYLRRFPLDVLKIDRSFVDGLGADDGDTEVVRAVIGLGHALRLTTVAEGVETERQHAMLHALGCDQAQGYRYSRPVPAGRLAPPQSSAAL